MSRFSRSGAIHSVLVAVLVLSLNGLGACSFPQRDSTPVTTYVIEPGQFNSKLSGNSPAHDLTLLVSTPVAGPGFSTSRMVYVETAYQLDYFAYHQWADSPARMLTPIIREAMEKTGLFEAVVTTPAPASVDLRLDSELVRLQQVFDGDNSEIQLAMYMRVVDLDTQTLLATETLSITERCRENTPYGGVLAANRAVERLIGQLAEFLDGAVARQADTD